MSGPGQTAFVTVGSTKFDALIRAVDDMEVVAALQRRGFSQLVIQLGSGTYLPSVLCAHGSHQAMLSHGFKVSWFDFAPSLQQLMQDADLVISHAGSGSLFEALHLRKVIIAVPNAILMHNHQVELAGHLEALGCLFSSSPARLVDVLQSSNWSKLKPYVAGDASGIVQQVNDLMGCRKQT